MPTVAEVRAALEAFAPPSLAASWDNVGLLLGDPARPADHVLTCLTLTPAVAEEAVEVGANLIVTHHPILFRGAKRLTPDTTDGRVVLTLARAGVAVYCPHTAFDDCPGGINDQLAMAIGLQNVRPLRPSRADECKIVVFVPDADLAKVSDAMFEAGAGRIGEYRECSFRLAGTGTFYGGETTQPTVGSRHRREEVGEIRLEVVCPRSKVEAVVAAMRSAHSYEEPAFDVYSLVGVRTAGGSGRIGELPAPVALGGVAERLGQRLGASVGVAGDHNRPIQAVAVACGAAGEYLEDASRSKADLFVTGEMRFHDLLAAQAAGIALALPGHFATERFAVEWLAEWLTKELAGVRATASRRDVDPLTWIDGHKKTGGPRSS